MNFNEFKQDFKQGTSVLMKDGKVVAVLSSLDKLKQAIEEDMEATIKGIAYCRTFDYGYKGEVAVKVEQDGETYENIFELYNTTLY